MTHPARDGANHGNRIEDEAACMRLCIDFANHIDARRYDAVLDLLTEDGTLDRMGKVFTGRTEISDFLAARSTAVETRHLVTNIRVHFDGTDVATGFSYVLFFQGSGASGTPTAVAPPCVVENTDHFERTPKGWRIRERRIRLAMQA